ncbi:MAG: bifunctional diguanylate cyclase/phosphodiesterase, partial [Acidobacteria bacterium]|nr:bifunctional diguanylate cyclase/phosphodiesterase [Acidobacteriota bacterium]
TNSLALTIGTLALIHFFSTSFIHIPLSRNFGKISIWQIWKRELFSISLGEILGAALAFVGYKFLYQARLASAAAALVLIFLIYINYRRTIADINDSIEQAEKAEREKVEIAKLKAADAEKHAGELELLLEKEEEISQDLRRSKEELEYSAFHDALTDLPNRAYLMERLKFLIELGMEMSKEYYVVFLDLSRFKNINDSLGHSIGDQVLKIVALRLRRLLRDEDSITRLGGDEFAIILTNLSSMEKAQKVASKIYETITKPYVINGNKIYCDLHVGIAPLDYEHVKPEDVIRDADIAMHHAKEKNIGIAVFDKNIRSSHLERIRLEADLRTAVERGELSMNYQPIISLKTGEMVGFEALLRWTHPELGFISPAQFIPISEESGSIIPITNWILKETCTQLSHWNRMRHNDRQLFVSVNISGRHLAEDDLMHDVQNALRMSGLAPELLKLEITESTAMENAERTIQILQNLNSLGVQLSIDDFGTGYSSLSYLHRLPFDTLKVDRSFVVNADKGDSEDLKILETIIALTRNLNKKVIAEGIETEQQLALLLGLECDFGQGYLFSKPLPAEAIPDILVNTKPWLEYNQRQISGGESVDISLDDNLRPF